MGYGEKKGKNGLSDSDVVFNLNKLRLDMSPVRMEKQHFCRVTEISVARQSTGGKVDEFSFEDNLLFAEQECVPLAMGAINLLVDWSDA